MKQKFNLKVPEKATAPVNEIEASEISEATSIVKKVEAVKEQPEPKEEKAKISAALNSLDQTKTKKKSSAYNSKSVPLSKIEYNPKNDYPVTEEGINDMADSILRTGLLHNLAVHYDEDTDKYILDSGERRTRAIRQLMERFSKADESVDYPEQSDEWYFIKNVYPFKKDGVPCNVKDIDNDIDSEIALIEANEKVRPSDPVQRVKRIERLNQLYQQKGLNANKIAIKIADDMGISKRQVIKYQNISKLIPELQEAFEQNKINLAEGNEICQLSETEQYNILELIRNTEQLSKEELERERTLAKKRDEEKRTLEEQIREKEEQLKLLSEEMEKSKVELETVAERIADQKAEEKIKKVEEEITAKAEELEKELKKKQAAEESLIDGKIKAELEAQTLKIEIERLRKEAEEKSTLSKKEKEKSKADYELELAIKETVKIISGTSGKISTYKKEYGRISLDLQEKVKDAIKYFESMVN